MSKYLRFPELLLPVAILSGFIIRPRSDSYDIMFKGTIYVLGSALVIPIFAGLLAISWFLHVRLRRRPNFLDLTNWIHVAVTLGCWYYLLFGKFATSALILLPLAQVMYWITALFALLRKSS